MTYTIEPVEIKSSSLRGHKYFILKDGRLIADYWHDYRGDEHEIKFINGTIDPWPVGRLVDFLSGGGPQPLSLTSAAVAYLDKMTQGSPEQ